MDNIQAVERQIDRAIWALDYLKADVNLHDVLYMLQYSHDERNLRLNSWSAYVEVSETLLKRIAVYEEQKKECVNEEACEPRPTPEYVDDCLKSLSIGLELLNPREVLIGPARMYEQENMVEKVKEDFRKVLRAMNALKGQEI